MADLTIAQFRGDFPEFTDPVAFPDTQVTFWLTVSTQMINADRWGTMFTVGQELYIAHNLVLSRQAQLSVAAGGVPGLTAGVVSSKSVGPVSISYDVAAVTSLDAAHWNTTVYGIRFITYAKMFGIGGLQVGAGFDLFGPLGSANAFFGPPFWPGGPGWSGGG